MSDVLPGHGRRSRSSTVLRRTLRSALALLCVVLGGLGGLAYHRSVPPTYTASTTVLVLPTAVGLDSAAAEGRAAGEVQIETESELLRSAQVAAAASERLSGALSAKQLLEDSSVTIPANSQVMVVDLVAGDPERARDGSMALAEAYLDRRSDESARQIEDVVTSLEEQLADLTGRLKKNSEQLAALATDDDTQRALLESDRELLVDQVSDINSRLVVLDIQTAPGGEIVTTAALPEQPTAPVFLFTVGGGVGLGILAGGSLLLGLSHLRSRRRVVTEHAPSSRVPVLATLALSQPAAGGPGETEERVHFVDEDEVLRRLCVKIASYHGVPGPTVIVGVGDPLLRTRVGASLNSAWAAEFGGSVLVLTEPGPHVAAVEGTAPGAAGLRDALRRHTGILDGAVVPVGSYAGVVGPGRDAHLVPTAAQRGLLPEIWTQLEREFGAVIVESGSPLDSLLAQSVAQTAGRFVVLVEVGVGQQRDLTSTLEEIEWLTLADRVAGVVIVSNRPAPSRSTWRAREQHEQY